MQKRAASAALLLYPVGVRMSNVGEAADTVLCDSGSGHCLFSFWYPGTAGWGGRSRGGSFPDSAPVWKPGTERTTAGVPEQKWKQDAEADSKKSNVTGTGISPSVPVTLFLLWDNRLDPLQVKTSSASSCPLSPPWGPFPAWHRQTPAALPSAPGSGWWAPVRSPSHTHRPGRCAGDGECPCPAA